jgi:hypothetical protein
MYICFSEFSIFLLSVTIASSQHLHPRCLLRVPKFIQQLHYYRSCQRLKQFHKSRVHKTYKQDIYCEFTNTLWKKFNSNSHIESSQHFTHTHCIICEFTNTYTHHTCLDILNLWKKFNSNLHIESSQHFTHTLYHLPVHKYKHTSHLFRYPQSMKHIQF